MLRQKDFVFEEDSIIFSECSECESHWNEELSQCEVCDNFDLFHETSHEGFSCKFCTHYFEMFEDCYIAIKENVDIYCCEDCFNKLPK